MPRLPPLAIMYPAPYVTKRAAERASTAGRNSIWANPARESGLRHSNLLRPTVDVLWAACLRKRRGVVAGDVEQVCGEP